MILPWYIPAAGAAIVTSFLAYGAHSLDVNRINAKASKVLVAQMQFDIKQCQDSKQITTKAETDYETQITTLNNELKRLRNQPSTCVPVTRPASKRNATKLTSKPSNGNGVTSGALLEYAGECETDRVKVNVLQGFIKDERK